MRIALLIAASLLATACNEQAADDEQAATGQVMAEATPEGALSAETPTALGFAKAVAMSDMYEVTAGNIALERATSPATKEFAQMMIADHTKSSQQLEQAIGGSGQDFSMPATLDNEHQAQIDVLESLQGEAFDREYLNQQMAAHRKTLGLLKDYGGNGDNADLRQFAQGTIPAVQKHADWLDANAGTSDGMPPAQ